MQSFKWNPKGTCIYGYHNNIGNCLLDHWSIKHFYFTGLAYIILHHYLKIKTINQAIYLTVFITILHTIEEYLENTTKYSLEGIAHDYIAPILKNDIDITKRELDNDYLQNSIGDVLSGIIACSLIIWYWKEYKKLPCFYLYGIIPVFIDLYNFVQKQPTKN